MKQRFETPYGHFAANGREYVITRPDTPRPWSNVICPGDYGVAITQAGSGYSWYQHASFNRLTRWEQDLIQDRWGKYLYCRDRESQTLWSLAWQPVQAKPRRYECRHGIGYTTIRALNEGIESALTVFVPPDAPLEIWRVRLRNRGRERRVLDLFSYFEWNLGPSPDSHREFHRLFIETEYEPHAHALLATKRLNTIAEHGRGQAWNVEWPHVAFHAASLKPVAIETDKESFLGRYGSLASPAAVRAGKLGGTTGKWQDGIGALQVAVTLAPGEAKDIVFTLGLADTRDEALKLARRHTGTAAAETAWKATCAHWTARLAPLQVRTPDPAFDVLTNVWLKYQAISARLHGRTGYYQPGGAFGYRDQLQDSQVFLPLDPAQTRRQILLHAAHQYADGTALHWWHPLTEDGVQKPLNDDLLWLPFVTLHYLRETADWSVLEEVVPYLARAGETAESGTLYDHCRRAIDSFWTRLSPRGVPRMGAGDWNDGLSAIGNQLQAESVWLAQFLIGIVEDWAEMEAQRAKPDARAIAKYRDEAAKMREAVNQHFWDGDWYVRATKDNGEEIGSKRCAEGKIFINSQTWAILNRVVPEGRLPKLLASLEQHLYKDYGPLALAPAYKTPDAEIGYLTRYAPGSRENGGLYTHAGVWAIQAECTLGRRDVAWWLYQSFCPILRGMDPELYKAEPYVTPGNVDGPDSPFYGRGGWTWYTGSAAWLFRVSTEWILGVRPAWDGLVVRPCLPPGWKGFHMTRIFRGATYEIVVRAGAKPRVRVDGKSWASDVIPAFADGRRHLVEVTLVAERAARTANGKTPGRSSRTRRREPASTTR